MKAEKGFAFIAVVLEQRAVTSAAAFATVLKWCRHTDDVHRLMQIACEPGAREQWSVAECSLVADAAIAADAELKNKARGSSPTSNPSSESETDLEDAPRHSKETR